MIPQILIDKIRQFDQSIPDWQIVDELNRPDSSNPKKLSSVEIGFSHVLRALGPVTGGQLLSSLETMQDSPGFQYLRYVFIVLGQAKLDISTVAARQTIDELVVANILPLAAANAIKALAEGEHLSWCEANSIEVNTRLVGLARGGVE